MAYGVKYRFQFDSVLGSPFRIDILKDGYSGAVLKRCIGEGAPVIRRDRSGAVCGTSLEIPGECSVDNEFEEFKTSVPFTFQARVYGGSNYGTLIWAGHVTPELMEAPDIAPPYDVQISCTDGLGELKYTDFPERGGDTLWSHLTYLLGLTGLSLDVTLVNDITHGTYAASRLLHETAVNLDFLAGKTCYEVLEAILASLHATITQYNGTWLIFRETGAQVNTSTPAIANAYVNGGRNATPIPVEHYGSSETHPSGWWPVGHMTHGNVPARKGMALTSENHYAPNLLSDTIWQPVNGGVNDGGWWSLPAAGDGMRNMGVAFEESITQKLLLSIKVRNVGAGSDAGKLSVKVKAVGSSYSGTATYYLSNGTYGRRNPTTDFGWSATEQDSLIEVQAPADTDTDDDFVEIGIVLPIFYAGARNYFRCSSLEVTISNGDGLYGQRIYGVTLSKFEQFSGFRKELTLNNGARGRGEDVDLAFTEIAGANDYAGVQEIQLGVLMDATSAAKVTVLKSGTFTTEMDYLSLMARDYALSIAGARRYVRGSLNVPEGHARIPVAFRDDHDNTYYYVDTFSWDLRHDEVSVDMTSRPVTAITVDDEVDEAGETGNATGHQQAQSSGSGGGGGGGGTGTVTSVALSIPTYFDITGSPVTGSGTLTASLKSTYKIPSTSEWSNVSGKAHEHSNKSILDQFDQGYISEIDGAISAAHVHSNAAALAQITATKINHWDAAYDAIGSLPDIDDQDIEHWNDASDMAHSHSNMSTLNGITSAKVTNWDAAYSASHSHSNKSTLDGITSAKVSHWDGLYNILGEVTAEDIADWDDAVTKAHSHSNKSVLDGITSSKVSNWDGAATNSHSHSNKSTLDGITSTKVTNWDNAASASHSHSNKSVLDGITSAKVTAWDDAAAAAASIDVGIGGTDAAPTVEVELGSGASDSATLPVASASKAGIVSTAAQTFAGAKTFDRIYLGNSQARGAYVEWDDTARAFKFVGDMYATGDVAAGN